MSHVVQLIALAVFVVLFFVSTGRLFHHDRRRWLWAISLFAGGILFGAAIGYVLGSWLGPEKGGWVGGMAAFGALGFFTALLYFLYVVTNDPRYDRSQGSPTPLGVAIGGPLLGVVAAVVGWFLPAKSSEQALLPFVFGLLGVLIGCLAGAVVSAVLSRGRTSGDNRGRDENR